MKITIDLWALLITLLLTLLVSVLAVVGLKFMYLSTCEMKAPWGRRS